MPVDYGRTDVAASYSRGRALNDAALAPWESAVTKHLPARTPLRVLDVGAGKGIFARAWTRWCQCNVVALEPSHAMRAEMKYGGIPEMVSLVAGWGERLPLKTDSFDVAWMSTVVHHLSDAAQCASELRRVLVTDGVVYIRGLFSDRGWPSVLRFIPGGERAVQTFPSTKTVHDTMVRQGFTLVDSSDVEEPIPSTVGEAVDRVLRLRHADSLLGQFSDDEIAEGLAAMDHLDSDEPVSPSRLVVLTFSS